MDKGCEGESKQQQQHHFVLVHGACHGGWCWYKLATLLRSAGHRVTAPDLAASGVDPHRDIREVATFSDYSQPLLEAVGSLPPNEKKVVLVGHSFGGMTLALAMDRFPEKIAVAVFVSAFMPDTSSRPPYVIEQHQAAIATPEYSWLMDSRLSFDHRGPEKPFTSILFGPKFLSSMLYQNCPPEDLTLATSLVRNSSLFLEDLGNGPKLFTDEGYGSVNRVYVICEEDKVLTQEFQRWMVENSPVKEVKVIGGADHMAMMSKPQELCRIMLDVADAYA